MTSLILLLILSLTSNVLSARIPSLASPFVGSPTSFIFPSAIPSIVAQVSSFFPDESQLGFPGPTPTGDEPELVATAISAPIITDNFPLVASPPEGLQSPSFDIFSKWGNLSPQKSIPQFDLPGASEIIPEGCQLSQVHILTRHASRYPTSTSSPAQFAQKVQGTRANNTGFSATGDLAFLNTWTYKLGAEILTPHGRGQMYRLGVKHAVEYGHLLEGYDKPIVTRSTSEDRMVESALIYRDGFFGRQSPTLSSTSLIIEEDNFNNTLAPYDTCNNSNNAIGNIAGNTVSEWQQIYLADALVRIQKDVVGLNLTVADLGAMQQLCSYESVALGYSSFCSLFTIQEWEGYEYGIDLGFYYDNSFGSPVSAAMGLGYLQDLLSRLTKTPITSSNSSVNSTLNANSITFPLDQPIYVDHSHDTIISTIIVALNFTSLNSPAPLPLTHIPPFRSFNTFYISPFASQLVGQVMSCPTTDPKNISKPATLQPYIRWILNDAVVSQNGMGECTVDKDGLCPLDVYIEALKRRNGEIDWGFACAGVYNATIGEVTNGQPPFGR